MATPKKTPDVTVMTNGEIRMTADLFPEEAKHGVLMRGFSPAEAAFLAGALLAAAEAVSGRRQAGG